MSHIFQESLHKGYGQSLEVQDVLFEHNTSHQHLMIFNNPTFGRVMTLDGVVQTTTADEFIYHEMLVHVPMFAHGDINSVLIIGGGDGGILREVLRHKTVESVTLVEIDQAVIEMCQHYFPKHSQGAFDDKRVNIVIDDGAKFVKEITQKYDLIICDSTDPMGCSVVLFQKPFYTACKKALNDKGIMVTQNGVMYFQLEQLRNTKYSFEELYKDYSFYKAAVPTYVGGDMAFGWASDEPRYRIQTLESLTKRFDVSGIKTRYYTPKIHIGAFALPQYVIDALCD
ncbi:polyamine aminopropyltransferase [Cysteiniphilum halobium]|uniref:polyamine aminopropyltransferase n=1 Tax=Cysteiniphilum halobium TaxID=2219059 RepID=UPI000E64A677|nr:polyamine aminopropyltransferase [Cysteiniphilum halobium]